MLHVVQAAELMLLHFRRRNVTLAVVWFDEAGAHLWQGFPFAALARHVLKAHFVETLSSHLTTVSFRSVRQAEWAERLELLDPSWVLLMDATSALASARDALYWKDLTLMFVCEYKRPVVLLPGLAFRGNDFFAWTLRVARSKGRREQGKRQVGVPDLPCSSTGVVLSADEAVAHALAVCGATARGCAVIAQAYEVCKRVPLASRGLDVGAPDATLISDMQRFCTALLPHASAAHIDVLDGRLVHALMHNAVALAPMDAVAPVAAANKSASRSERFLANYHYHNGRPLAARNVQFRQDAPPKPTREKIRVKVFAFRDSEHLTAREREARANDQKRLAARIGKRNELRAKAGTNLVMQRLADSMLGPNVQHRVVEVGAKNVVKAKAAVKGDKKGGDGKKPASKANDIRQQAAQRKDAENLQRDKKVWQTWRADFPTMPVTQALTWLRDESLFGDAFLVECINDLVGSASTQLEACVALVELVWLAERDGNDVARRYAVAGAKKHGFMQLAAQLMGARAVDVQWIDMNLRRLSERLPREVGAPDPRVRDFRPDDWQRQLLDYVDAKRSVVVVAPTSAGKTFIQYYAMEQVLSEGNDGVLVYVCPTNALCNQVMAGVTARFENVYPYEGTRCVVGLFTRDERRNMDKCQVLVTVPQCLDVLLLAPTTEAQDWVKRIAWCIFDEVHNINDPHNGPVWERLLQLT